MRLIPRSLSGRLLAVSALTSIAALAFAAFSIGSVLERFVIRGLDQQLDAEVAMLTRAVRPDGVLDQRLIVNLPAFEAGRRGWGWRVEGTRGRWSGGDPIVERPPPEPDRFEPPDMDMADREPRPGDGIASSGERVHVRQLSVPTGAGPVIVTAGGPRRVAMAPMREAMVPLLASLALLGGALALATAAQLRFGLRPLRRLRGAVADVRMGRARHVPTNQPDELAPLATELNSLLDQNAAQLDHARRHVSNLAHGLKTPLAALALRLAEGGRDPDGSLAAMVADIDGRVRHHLGRARAAAPGGGQRASTRLAAAVDDLVGAMRGIHAGRAVDAAISVAPELAVLVDPQDLDELLGNLLDNAWRHARSRVSVTACRKEGEVEIIVADDGPGLSPDEIALALMPGRRLDERGGGHGFGLPIAQELAELNGGQLTLSRAESGGLQAGLLLPAARK
ncbi:sensor histidine kinase [Sphingomonas ginkgonis]|uniref:histidine kinase n=1 Tax=Sphingomonas ginkgonis TaxID=2315330 RepID=A0A3R9YKC7_9SPHN|nr:HAMP domain-containing sensor histidine kinase [Sphingomonas ginkgonis]RST31823.1 sensor histidine kinase [Sphingomonas ginkgonis]